MYPDQYPDKLVRQDGSEISCRFYPGSRGSSVKKVVDGAEVDARFTVALPVDCPQLLADEVITGYDKSGEVVVWEASIILFHRGQLHCVTYV